MKVSKRINGGYFFNFQKKHLPSLSYFIDNQQYMPREIIQESQNFSYYLWDQLVKEHKKKTRIESVGDPDEEPNLLNISLAIDEFFVYHKLKVYCAFLSYSKLVHPLFPGYSKRDFALVQEVVQLVESGRVIHPIVKIYNQIRILFEGLEEKNDDIFRNALFATKKILLKTNLQDSLEILSLLSNYAIWKINSGRADYLHLSFDINNEVINVKYRFGSKYKNKLPGQVYKNMIVAAIKLENSKQFNAVFTVGLNDSDSTKKISNGYDWAIQFLEAYKSKLNKRDLRKYPPFCAAYIEFKRNNFVEAFRKIGKPKYIRGTFISLDTKVLYLQILFELFERKPPLLEKNNIEIEKEIDALSSSLKYDKGKKKKLDYHFHYFEVFIRLFRSLYRLRSRYKTSYLQDDSRFITKKAQLLDAIGSCKFSFKNWFEKKMKFFA